MPFFELICIKYPEVWNKAISHTHKTVLVDFSQAINITKKICAYSDSIYYPYFITSKEGIA